MEQSSKYPRRILIDVKDAAKRQSGTQLLRTSGLQRTNGLSLKNVALTPKSLEGCLNAMILTTGKKENGLAYNFGSPKNPITSPWILHRSLSAAGSSLNTNGKSGFVSRFRWHSGAI